MDQQHRKTMAETQCDPTFMKRIITGDEAWVYENDMETKQNL